MSLAISLHILAAIVWVGGMFFAYMAQRPAAVEVLEPPQRLKLWVATFRRFFPWVWAAIIALLATGFWMLFDHFGGMKGAPLYVHAMLGLGILMMLIFFHVFFAPYNRLKRAVAAEDWAAGGKALSQIRLLVGINTAIGLLTAVVGAAGPYLVP
ncbi:MAG: CopD family protein [Gammaproteobacteria bacterium]|nr:CopD family protein [Gammaproteobacteria bacterium]MDX5375007.1 CopD family protein [Gammaproteobacteria bacterium]